MALFGFHRNVFAAQFLTQPEGLFYKMSILRRLYQYIMIYLILKCCIFMLTKISDMLLTSFNKYTLRVLSCFFLVFTSVLLNHNSIYAQPDATFEFTYSLGTPDEAKEVIEFCGDVASNYFNSSVPITVFVNWDELGYLDTFSNNLGAASSTNYTMPIEEVFDIVPDDSPFNDFWNGEVPWFSLVNVPAALANSHSGFDQNVFTFDLLFSLDGNETWNFDTTDPPLSTIDSPTLVRTVLHELIHGLGFGSDFSINYINGNVEKPWIPSLYDTYLVVGNSSSIPLMSLEDEDVTAALTSGPMSVFWDGPKAREMNLGERVPLWTPTQWDQGVSLSHLHDAFWVVAPNGLQCGGSFERPLMAPSSQESTPGIIDPITVGIMEDLGWSMDCPNPGCSNIEACNYDWTACPNSEDPMDSEDCFYGDEFYIPVFFSNDLVRVCDNCDDFIPYIPYGYILANEACILSALQEVAGNSGNGLSFTWTSELKEAYECCLNNVGCPNPDFCNYNPNVCGGDEAACSDCATGQHCITINMSDSNSDGWDGASFFIDTGQGSIEGTLDWGSSGSKSICLWEGCFTFEVFPGNTPNQIGWEISGLPGGPISSSPGSNVGSFDFAIGWDNIGCTDESACNYEGACIEPQVIIGGGDACTYPSCFDDNACNFIPPGPDDCPDNSLCIYGSDNSVPSITLTEWFISVEPITGWDGFILDDLIFEDQNGQLNFGGDELFGTWTLCEGEITLTGDNGNIYFANYDFINGYFQGMVLDNVFNPIGTFAMYPFQTVGCIDSSACNYNPLADYDDDSCDYISCADCCGVPNGDGSSCDGDCGPCGDNTSCLDACGVPNGDNSSCTDCCGVINGYGYTCDGDCGPCGDSTSCLDECGVINGDNTSCADCCGVPNGNGSTCDGDCGPCGDISCYGCTDSGACNFLPFATIDDGNCTYSNTPVIEVVDFQWLFIIGCYLGATELEQSFNINNTWELNNFEGQGYWTLCGSDLMLYRSDGSLLFDGSWTIEDNTFAGEYYSQDGMTNDCSKIQLIASSNGCTDAIACNFDSSAAVDDGSCDYYSSPPINLLDTEWYLEYDFGCNGNPGNEIWTLNSDFTYETSSESVGNWSLCGISVTLLFENGYIYNGDYNISGGYFEGIINSSPSCFTMSPVVEGCTDSTACNYNDSANTDDGTCEFTSCLGCTDAIACNFDSSVSVDDGNCDYYSSPPTNLLDTEWSVEYDWGCNGNTGNSVWTLNSNFTFESSTGSVGNWSLCGLSFTLLFGGSGTEYNGDYNITGGYFEGTMNGSPSNCFTMSPVVVEGCTDSTACNYNASANTDDGSCIYPTCDDPLACNYDECSDPISICYDATACYDASACTYAIGWSLGCTYIDAINYDPIATVDDGSCEYDLQSICGAGTYYDAVTSSCLPDGTVAGDGCPGDLDNDGFVNTNDLLLFLALFGTTCP